MNDTLFDAKLKQTLLLAVTVDYAEVLSEPEGEEPPWSLPYRRQRKKMLADPNKWCRERVRPVWKRALYRAACILLVAALTLGSLMAVSPTVRAWVFSWIHTFTENGDVEYSRSDTAKQSQTVHEGRPQWRPTWMPEGWTLTHVGGWLGEDSVQWLYDGEDGTDSLSFHCCYDSTSATINLFIKEEDMKDVYEPAQVWGRSADYYGGELITNLVWEGEDGTFFNLNMVSEDPALRSKETLVKIAESVEWYEGAQQNHTPGFVPEGYVLKESGRYSPNPYELNGSGKCFWVAEGGSLTFLYTECPASPLRIGDGEPITVNGIDAVYYPPTMDYAPIMQDNTPEPTVEVIDGKFKVTYPEYDPEDYPPTVRSDAVYPHEVCSAICWTNADGVQILVEGTLDRETLLIVAESIVPGTISPAEPSR